MSSTSLPSPNNIPIEVIALAWVFFTVAMVLVVVVGLISFSGELVRDVIIIWILMAIWFVFVVYTIWSDE